jgi:serine/threonine protein phosphatase PrpC
MYDKLRRSRRLDAVQSGCSTLFIVKQGDLMVVANVDDSRVVLGTDSTTTPSHRPAHRPPEAQPTT